MATAASVWRACTLNKANKGCHICTATEEVNWPLHGLHCHLVLVLPWPCHYHTLFTVGLASGLHMTLLLKLVLRGESLTA